MANSSSQRTVRPRCNQPRPASATGIGRVGVTAVEPVAEGGRWPAKAIPGEAVPVSATVFMEGHDAVGATAVLTSPCGKRVLRQPMRQTNAGLARWEGLVVPDEVGEWTFRVEGWFDPYATWLKEARIKLPIHQDVEVVLETGAQVLDRAGGRRALPAAQKEALTSAATTMRDKQLDTDARFAAAAAGPAAEALAANPMRIDVSKSADYPLRVQRERTLVGSWYELFPRSIGAHFSPDEGWISGTLQTCAANLDRVAAMGFDVVYLTPVHPIGMTFRKGRNNALRALPGDPGSPYAIGSEDGGHDAIHPELGTFKDFDQLVKRARQLGLEVALDFALQCSPDHPWVKQHPEWFTHRPDGSIAYAENPPKKYQDIYPLNFDNDPEGIYQEILRIVRLWIAHGVSIFRVDNPHTKPLPFWERLLTEVAAESPDVVFLAEAFTRPPMMQTLALIGFHQSYTYFAWRNSKTELEDYVQELASDQGSFLRPSIWPTTHDILTPYMQQGGRAAFKIRAILAATFAPTWGIYSGYELIEDIARPGSEEQIDNEKYEFKARDYAEPGAMEMEGLLTRLNAARREHLALRRLRNVAVHPTTDPAMVAFSRHVPAEVAPDGQADTVLVVVNIDPHNTREGLVELDLAAIGLGDAAGDIRFHAHDLLSGQTYDWGREPFVRLDPATNPGHLIHLVPAGGRP